MLVTGQPYSCCQCDALLLLVVPDVRNYSYLQCMFCILPVQSATKWPVQRLRHACPALVSRMKTSTRSTGYLTKQQRHLLPVGDATCRWLKPGGAILPDLASLHMAAAGAGATGLTFWNKVYGFDYSLVQQELREDAHQTALLKDVSSQDLLSCSCLLRQLDIAHMDAADASFSTDFILEADPKVVCRAQRC